jgi:hypothetical protein
LKPPLLRQQYLLLKRQMPRLLSQCQSSSVVAKQHPTKQTQLVLPHSTTTTWSLSTKCRSQVSTFLEIQLLPEQPATFPQPRASRYTTGPPLTLKVIPLPLVVLTKFWGSLLAELVPRLLASASLVPNS